MVKSLLEWWLHSCSYIFNDFWCKTYCIGQSISSGDSLFDQKLSFNSNCIQIQNYLLIMLIINTLSSFQLCAACAFHYCCLSVVYQNKSTHLPSRSSGSHHNQGSDKKDHPWLSSCKYWQKLRLEDFSHPLWRHVVWIHDTCYMNCAPVYNTTGNTWTNEWYACTQQMTAGGMYLTPISLHLQQALEKSVSRAQAGWVNVSAPRPPQRMLWPVIFIFSPTHASNPCMLLSRDDI